MSLARGCQSATSMQKEVVILDELEMGYTLALRISKSPSRSYPVVRSKVKGSIQSARC